MVKKKVKKKAKKGSETKKRIKTKESHSTVVSEDIEFIDKVLIKLEKNNIQDLAGLKKKGFKGFTTREKKFLLSIAEVSKAECQQSKCNFSNGRSSKEKEDICEKMFNLLVELERQSKEILGKIKEIHEQKKLPMPKETREKLEEIHEILGDQLDKILAARYDLEKDWRKLCGEEPPVVVE